METIPVFKPLLGKDEIQAAMDALELGWLGMGGYVGQFEEAIRRFLGVSNRYVAAVSTGHAALHLGLLLSGVGPGDEVITPSLSNVADFQAILATGARPVFCDVDNDTLCVDSQKAERLITGRTKAILVADRDCTLCDHQAVEELAAEYSLRVIHDAAGAFGSEYRSKRIGTFSDVCIFSFDPVKTLTCIDGGALVVRTEKELDLIHEMRLVGMGQPSSVMYQNRQAGTCDVKRLGFRYHMANLHAAVGLAQLKKIDIIAESRRTACRYYNRKLSPFPQLSVPKTDFQRIVPSLYYIRVPAEDRHPLRTHLRNKGVDTGIHWQPGHWFTLLKGCRRGDLSVTDKAAKEVLSLPLHSLMPVESLDRVVEGVRSFYSTRQRRRDTGHLGTDGRLLPKPPVARRGRDRTEQPRERGRTEKQTEHGS